MNLKQLEYFVHVAELGSFSKAALVLGIAQPALSRQVRALEVDLRETLLLRNGRGVELTEPGRRLMEHGVAILQQMERAREDIVSGRDEPAGAIVIGLPPSIGRQLTLPLIDAVRRRLPRARLSVVEGLSAHITEWILTGRVDIGLVHNPGPEPALETTPVLAEDLCLITRRDAAGERHPRRRPLKLRELPAWPLIVPERSHTMRKLLEAQAALAGIKLEVAWEVSSIPSIIDLVCAGYGNAVLSASAVNASGRASELSVQPLVEPRLTSVLCLAASATRRATPLQRQAAQLLTELVAALLAGDGRLPGASRGPHAKAG
jgi:LysR family nitrogen assimilation transcriptional regulator